MTTKLDVRSAEDLRMERIRNVIFDKLKERFRHLAEQGATESSFTMTTLPDSAEQVRALRP